MKATPFLLSVLAAGYAAADVTLTEPIKGSLTIDDGQTYTLTHQVEADTAPKDTTKALDLADGTILVSGAGSELYVKTDGSLSVGSGDLAGSAQMIAANGGKITLIGSQVAHSSGDVDDAHHFWLGATPVNVSADVLFCATGEGSEFLIDFRDFSGAGSTNWGGVFTGVKPYRDEEQNIVLSQGTVTFSASDGGILTLTNVNDYTTNSHYGQFLQASNQLTKLEVSSGGVLSIGGKYTTIGKTKITVESGGTLNFGRSVNVNPVGNLTTDVSADVSGADSVINFRKSIFIASVGNVINIQNGGVVNVGAMLRCDGYGKDDSASVSINIDGQGSKLNLLQMAPGEEGSWTESKDGNYYKAGLNAYDGGQITLNLSNGAQFEAKTADNSGAITATVGSTNGHQSRMTLSGTYTSSGTSVVTCSAGGLIEWGAYSESTKALSAYYDANWNVRYKYVEYSPSTTITLMDGGALEVEERASFANASLAVGGGSHFTAASLSNSGSLEFNLSGGTAQVGEFYHWSGISRYVINEDGTLAVNGSNYVTEFEAYDPHTQVSLTHGAKLSVGDIVLYSGEASFHVGGDSEEGVQGGEVSVGAFTGYSDMSVTVAGKQSVGMFASCSNYGKAAFSATNGGTIQLGTYQDITEIEYEGQIYTYTPQTTISLTNGGRLVLGTPSSQKARSGAALSLNGAIVNIDGSSQMQSYSSISYVNSTFYIHMDDISRPAIVMEPGATLNWGDDGEGNKNQVNITLGPDALASSSKTHTIVVVDGNTNFNEGGSNNVAFNYDSPWISSESPEEKQEGDEQFVITLTLSEQAVEDAKSAFSAAGTGVANALHSSVSAVQGFGAAALSQLHYRPATESRFWVQGLGDFVRAGGHNSSPGYHYNGGGYAVGYDHAVAERLVLGAAFGQQFGVNKTRMEETRVRQHATMGTLYGRYSYDCPRGCITRVVDGYASYGSVRNRGRSVLFGERATGRWDDDVFNVGFRFGWQVPLNAQKSWTLTPFIGLEYSYGSQGDAHLVSANYERRYHDGSMQVWSLPVGATLQGRCAVSGTRYLLPELTLAYVGDVARRDPRVKAAVLGEETVYEGTEPGRHALRLQVGTRYTLTENITTGLFYSLDYRARDCEQRVDASISVSF